MKKIIFSAIATLLIANSAHAVDTEKEIETMFSKLQTELKFKSNYSAPKAFWGTKEVEDYKRWIYFLSNKDFDPNFVDEVVNIAEETCNNLNAKFVNYDKLNPLALRTLLTQKLRGGLRYGIGEDKLLKETYRPDESGRFVDVSYRNILLIKNDPTANMYHPDNEKKFACVSEDHSKLFFSFFLDSGAYSYPNIKVPAIVDISSTQELRSKYDIIYQRNARTQMAK